MLKKSVFNNFKIASHGEGEIIMKHACMMMLLV